MEINGYFIYPNLENIDENKKTGKKLLIDECKKYSTSVELLRKGGFSLVSLDLYAFGFFEDSIKSLMTKNLKIKWVGDIENVYYEVEKSGLSKLEWSKKINLTEPIDVSFNGKSFFVEDGHHRYFAAKTLKKPLNINLEIKASTLKFITDLGYDEFHHHFFNKVKGI